MNESQHQLVDHCFELAQEMLVMNGQFHPIGAYLNASNRVQLMGIEIEPRKVPNNGKIIEDLHKLASTEQFGQYATCYEVAIQVTEDGGPTDAICVELSDESLPTFYQPFQLSEDEINFDEIFAVAK